MQSHPSLPSLLLQETTVFLPSHGPSQRLKSRPGQDQLGPGGRQSRPLLCREPHPGLGKGRGSRVCLFLWPLGGALVRAGLPLGSPSFPLLPRAPGTFLGPDLGFFPQPLLPTTRPSVSPRGLPSCPLTPPPPPATLLAGAGIQGDSPCSLGRTKSWGALISSSSSRWLPPRKQLMSPSAWAPVPVPPGPYLPSLPARRPVLLPSVLAPEGPEVTRAQPDCGC